MTSSLASTPRPAIGQPTRFDHLQCSIAFHSIPERRSDLGVSVVGYEFEVPLSARDAVHAVDAASRLNGERRGFTVMLRSTSVLLGGSGSEDDARLSWRIALLNERLVVEADAARTVLLGSLVA